MFAAMVPSFDALGCDTRYFHEHIAVDADEHASWMADAVRDVVERHGPESVDAVLCGMADAWVEMLEVPDALWLRAPGPSPVPCNSCAPSPQLD